MTGWGTCPDDFDLLLSSCCDTGLKTQERARLDGMLRTDPELRRRYLIYMGVHATLHYLIAEQVPRLRGTGRVVLGYPDHASAHRVHDAVRIGRPSPGLGLR